MPEPIRVGIVGAGDIARNGHAPHYDAHPDFELVAVADVDRERASALAEPCGAHPYESLAAMLQGETLEAVSVCTHNRHHAEATIAALEAGLHVYCEKPPAMNERQAQEMADAARRARRVLLYGLFYRHMVPTASPFATPAELGQLYYAVAQWVRRRGIRRGPFSSLEIQGGGAMIDLGVHVLDLAWWLCGCPDPISVQGTTQNLLGQREVVEFAGHPGTIDPTAPTGWLERWSWFRRRGRQPAEATPSSAPTSYEVEDTALAVYRFEDDLSIRVHAAFAANVSLDESVYVQLHGAGGGLRVPLVAGRRKPEDNLPSWHHEIHGVLCDTTLARPMPPTVQEGYWRGIDHFAKVIRGDEDPMITPEQGVVLMRMLDGFYEAARTGDPVDLRRS